MVADEPLLCDYLFGFLWAGLRESWQWYWILALLLDLCCALPINASVSGTWTCSVCRRHGASHSSCSLVPVLKAQVRLARAFLAKQQNVILNRSVELF